MKEMQEILQVKLRPPLIQKSVIRNRLLKEINRALETEGGFYRKLTLVVAPAGYGKTSLLFNYYKQIKRDSCWLTFSKDDNLSNNMLVYLATTIMLHEKNNFSYRKYQFDGEDLSADEEIKLGKRLLIEILNRIGELDTPLYIFLDELEHIHSKIVYKLLEFFIENLPPTAHVIAATRVEPPWPIIRWKARRQAKIIDSKNMQFNIKEIMQFMEQQNKDINELQAKELFRKTEGWVTGLQLISLMSIFSVKRVMKKEFPESKNEIMKYLTEEVLAEQEKEIREFLLRTAPLPYFNQELCRLVTGMDNCHQLLEEIFRRNLFLRKINGKNNGYCYHNLFAETLCYCLQMEDPGLKKDIHQQAAEWFLEKDLYEEAVEQALLGEDYDKMIQIIFKKNDIFFRSGKKSFLKKCLNEVPKDFLEKRLELLVVWALLSVMEGNLTLAENYLLRADDKIASINQFDMNSENINLLQGMLAIGTAVLKIFQGDRDVQSYLETANKLLPPDFYWKKMIELKYGDLLALNGDINAALKYYRKIRDFNEGEEYGCFDQLAGYKEAYLLWFQGFLKKTLDLCDKQLEEAEKHNLSCTTWIAAFRALRANIYCEENEMEKAEKELIKAQEIISFNGYDIFIELFIKIMCLRYYYSTENFSKAKELITNLNILECKDSYEVLVNHLIVYQIRFWLNPEFPGNENWKDALILLSSRGILPEKEVHLSQLVEYLALGRVLLSGEKFYESEKVLNRVLRSSLNYNIAKSALETRLVLVQLYNRTGRSEKALIEMKKVLQIASKQGFFSLIVDEGEEIKLVIEELKFSGVELSTKVKHLVKRLDIRYNDVQQKNKQSLEVLSQREIEVLEQIAAGYSSKEIAAILKIAPGTVRWHCSNIYSKLEVSNRTRAVSKAREQGILQ